MKKNLGKNFVLGLMGILIFGQTTLTHADCADAYNQKVSTAKAVAGPSSSNPVDLVEAAAGGAGSAWMSSFLVCGGSKCEKIVIGAGAILGVITEGLREHQNNKAELLAYQDRKATAETEARKYTGPQALLDEARSGSIGNATQSFMTSITALNPNSQVNVNQVRSMLVSLDAQSAFCRGSDPDDMGQILSKVEDKLLASQADGRRTQVATGGVAQTKRGETGAGGQGRHLATQTVAVGGAQ